MCHWPRFTFPDLPFHLSQMWHSHLLISPKYWGESGIYQSNLIQCEHLPAATKDYKKNQDCTKKTGTTCQPIICKVFYNPGRLNRILKH